MKKRARIGLGLATAWPFLYVGFLLTSRIYVQLLEDVAAVSGLKGRWLDLVSSLEVVTVAWTGGLFLVYIVLLYRNRGLDSAKRVRWIGAFLLLAPLAFPFYWYYHVWSLPEEDAEGLALGD